MRRFDEENEMGVREDLVAAKALIDTPEKWAHESKDRVYEGGKCLCAIDAVNKVCGPYNGTFDKAEAALTKQLPDSFVPDANKDMLFVAQFNDSPTTTHADIMALYDRAIASVQP